MVLPEIFVDETKVRLASAGFFTASLGDLGLPNTQHVSDSVGNEIAYQVHGDLGAPNIVVQGNTFFTRTEKPHETLRNAAKQATLGKDYAIVAIDAYDPKNHYNEGERAQLIRGSFAPLVARQLLVLEHIGVHPDTKLIRNGYSMAADIAIQGAHDSIFDPNRGMYDVQAVGAYEMARSVNRSVPEVAAAMMTSGKKLPQNILASGMPALNEAWGITRPKRAALTVNLNAGPGIVKYLMAHPGTNLDIVRGFSSDTSTRQATEIVTRSKVPVVLGREQHSKITPIEAHFAVSNAIADAFKSHQLTLISERGELSDHSGDDNLVRSAARLLHLVSRIAT